MKFIITLIVGLSLVACSSTPSNELEDTELYVAPKILLLESVDDQPVFSKLEKRKALRFARKTGSTLLMTVIIDKEGAVKKLKARKLDKDLVAQDVEHMKSHVKKLNFKHYYALNPQGNTAGAAAFFIPWSVEFVIE